MPVVFSNKKTVPTPAQTPAVVKEYDILDALAELGKRKEVLMLVHRTEGHSYRVLSYDAETGKTKLKGAQGELLYPRISEREVKNWTALWR